MGEGKSSVHLPYILSPLHIHFPIPIMINTKVHSINDKIVRVHGSLIGEAESLVLFLTSPNIGETRMRSVREPGKLAKVSLQIESMNQSRTTR